MLSCPNKRLKVWKTLVANVGEPKAYLLWAEHEGNVPDKFYNFREFNREGDFIEGKYDVVVTERNYSPEFAKEHPEYIFVFGDNLLKTGKGGQAIIRDEPNAYGIPTKKAPNNSDSAFMTDAEYEDNVAAIDEAIDIMYANLPVPNGKFVLPKGGLGTGLAKLKEKAPRTYDYLRVRLLEDLGFDNETGTPVIEENELIYDVKDQVKYIPMSFYEVTFSQPYKEDSSIKSLGAYNPTDGIRVKPRISKEAFMEHISGKGKERGSEQKKIVFDSLVKDYGYDVREIEDFFETEEDIKAFIIFHEISHLENNDSETGMKATKDIYIKLRQEGLTEEQATEQTLEDRLYHPEVIAFEIRATIDAFNSMRIVKDTHRKYVKFVAEQIDSYKYYNEEGDLGDIRSNEFTAIYSPEGFKKFMGRLGNTGQLGFDFGNNPCK